MSKIEFWTGRSHEETGSKMYDNVLVLPGDNAVVLNAGAGVFNLPQAGFYKNSAVGEETGVFVATEGSHVGLSVLKNYDLVIRLDRGTRSRLRAQHGYVTTAIRKALAKADENVGAGVETPLV